MAWETPEIGRAFFHPGIASLLTFGGHVVKEGGIASELLQSGLPVTIRVEGGFEAAEGKRGFGEHFAAPLDGFGFEPFERHDGIDESETKSFRGIIDPAEKPNLSRLFLADDAGEVAGPVTSIEGTDFGAGLSEFGIVGGDGEIAEDVQDMASADSPAGNHCHDGFGTGADLPLKIQDIEAFDAAFISIPRIATHFDIPAGTKSIGALARENDDPDSRIVARIVEGRLHFADGERSEGIADFRAVDGNFGDAFGLFVTDVGEWAGDFPVGDFRHEKMLAGCGENSIGIAGSRRFNPKSRRESPATLPRQAHLKAITARRPRKPAA